MKTEFNLSKLKQDTNKGTPRFIRFAYAEEDVKEFIRLLKEKCDGMGTETRDSFISANSIIYKLAGEKLI